jgi:hypothetical protein
MENRVTFPDKLTYTFPKCESVAEYVYWYGGRPICNEFLVGVLRRALENLNALNFDNHSDMMLKDDLNFLIRDIQKGNLYLGIDHDNLEKTKDERLTKA